MVIRCLGGNLLLNVRSIYLETIRSKSMLEMIDIGVEKTIAYRFDGKITEEEMTAILATFREK